jgi:hypothetical protein
MTAIARKLVSLQSHSGTSFLLPALKELHFASQTFQNDQEAEAFIACVPADRNEIRKIKTTSDMLSFIWNDPTFRECLTSLSVAFVEVHEHHININQLRALQELKLSFYRNSKHCLNWLHTLPKLNTLRLTFLGSSVVLDDAELKSLRSCYALNAFYLESSDQSLAFNGLQELIGYDASVLDMLCSPDVEKWGPLLLKIDRLGPIPDKLLTFLKERQCPLLSSLILDVDSGGNYPEHLQCLRAFPRLTRLELYFNYDLSPIPLPSTLHTIEIKDSSLSFAWFAILLASSSLVTFLLSGTHINGRKHSFSRLSDQACLPNLSLRTLELRDCSFDDFDDAFDNDFVLFIVTVARQLRDLRLENVMCGEEFFLEVAKLPSLVKLDIDKALLTRASLDALRRSRSLQRFSVWKQCNIDENLSAADLVQSFSEHLERVSLTDCLLFPKTRSWYSGHCRFKSWGARYLGRR